MFPNRSITRSATQGAALPVALFIIVVMALVGAALVRIIVDTSSGVVNDVIGQRAFNAARSGAELFLVQLFPLDEPTNESLCGERDAALSPDDNDDLAVYTESFTTAGLHGCSAHVYCDFAAAEGITHFRIVSQGRCDAGDLSYTKELLLEASDGAL